ncbi:MAG: ATP-binding cassette domain-containing protein [Alphaproteobacteria bacterium]|nr:ATP-binding cassette domain-containing protein [Alphaproteobacteria bacterium]MDX5369445.1 ATP-binding cassette domain-containing protein [Alphaproteobacteria bacterium]MDX5464123.1 ATP-binding cassette domain-containing protein [Alphaproteobacteria bacterium]
MTAAPALRMPGTRQTDAATLIATQDLGVRRGGRWLVRHVDLEVAEREIVTLIGPNGGGKTTVVRTLLGLEKRTEGEIVRAPGLTVGYVPQRFTVPRTLPLPVHRLMTLTVRASRADVVAALEETGVAQLVDAPAHTLSGGELQRVLLARALIARPQLMVLDEPVQGVDFAGEAALYDLIGEIRDRHGCGILLVSHDLHVVMAATDRVVCLNGHVCCTGAPRTVSRDKEFLRLFGPKAAGTYALYAHAHDHEHDLTGDIVDAHGHHHDLAHEHGHGHKHGPEGGA